MNQDKRCLGHTFTLLQATASRSASFVAAGQHRLGVGPPPPSESSEAPLPKECFTALELVKAIRERRLAQRGSRENYRELSGDEKWRHTMLGVNQHADGVVLAKNNGKEYDAEAYRNSLYGDPGGTTRSAGAFMSSSEWRQHQRQNAPATTSGETNVISAVKKHLTKKQKKEQKKKENAAQSSANRLRNLARKCLQLHPPDGKTGRKGQAGTLAVLTVKERAEFQKLKHEFRDELRNEESYLRKLLKPFDETSFLAEKNGAWQKWRGTNGEWQGPPVGPVHDVVVANDEVPYKKQVDKAPVQKDENRFSVFRSKEEVLVDLGAASGGEESNSSDNDNAPDELDIFGATVEKNNPFDKEDPLLSHALAESLGTQRPKTIGALLAGAGDHRVTPGGASSSSPDDPRRLGEDFSHGHGGIIGDEEDHSDSDDDTDLQGQTFIQQRGTRRLQL